MKIKKGDIVGRKSYGKDILFTVDRIIKTRRNEFAILKGITIRIEADAPIEDLEIIDKDTINTEIKADDKRISERISCWKMENRYTVYTGKILHLDGDTHLSNLKKYRNINTSKQVIFNHY